ncbi:MAG: neutral/alkaline non-lysosomal ceramidase N-terminal domain-containing protein, partial [Myxococcales bacterium]|nr:neutral/alkaline non-lysosomal ceramidase N-terminal domain-containing protein [Myxococcales bacterium]
GSDRYFEEQDVRAIALSTADDVLILVRFPLCWSTDYLLTRTALKVQAATGVNYADKIVSFATHSHSQPGRFWNLVPATGFGIFGYGQFSSEMVERYSDSFAAAIVQALGDMKPAKVGVRVVDDFDPARRIHSNRRSEFPEFTDDRMTVIRVDEADGTPMAAVVSLAIHGTHMELPWVTGDVAGGIEVVATQKLSAEAGRYVPVIFANGNAANVSPRGDDGTEVNWGKMQVVGHRVWPIFKAAWDAVETQAAPVLEVVQKRIPVSYSLLGYDRSVPEFRANDGTAQEYGAFQCVAQGHERDEPPYRDGALGCLLNLQTFLGQPTVQLQKTVMSAFRIDNTVIATLPGEPSSQLGLELAADLEADARAAGLAGVRAVNFGYAMDHHLYLVLEDDWFRGGYEAAQGLWGWKLGRYFLNNARDLAGQLFTAEREDNTTPIKPTIWPDLADDTVLPTAGAMAAGTLVMDTPAAAVRGDLLELRWIGGHPGVDRPDVVLQVAGEDGSFTDVVRAGVRFDDRGFETLTFYLGDFEGDHLWAVRWELPFDMPVGRYRIHVAGEGVQGEGTAPYSVDGAAFDLGPATLVARDVGVADGVLALRVNYPDGPSNDDGESAFEALEIRGHLLRLDPEMRYDGALKRWSFLLGAAVPLAGLTATMDDVALETVAAPDAVGRTLVTSRAEDGTEGTIDLAGWSSTRLEIQAPAAPATVRISDAWGNFVDVEIAAER